MDLLGSVLSRALPYAANNAGDALNFAGPLLLNQLLRHLATAAGAARDDAGSGSGGAAAAPSAPLAARWFPDVADPRFGYGCAALLAASLFLKVRHKQGRKT